MRLEPATPGGGGGGRPIDCEISLSAATDNNGVVSRNHNLGVTPTAVVWNVAGTSAGAVTAVTNFANSTIVTALIYNAAGALVKNSTVGVSWVAVV